MQIKFQFDLPKTLQVLAYLLREPVDKVKLMKLVYLADRAHFIGYGYPITGDKLCAMRYGPVPSNTLDAVDGEMFFRPEIFATIHVDDNTVSVRANPGVDLLRESEKKVLDEVLAEHGGKETWALVEETHRLPEYKEVYVEGTSRVIPFEKIAEVSGAEARFRQGRPVISVEMAERMRMPLADDSDL